MLHSRVKITSGLALTAVLAVSLGAQAPDKPLPLKYVGPATVPAITAGDLMTRLYKYADDSMGGRPVGTPEHLKAVAYIESEVRRLGLKPAGDNGTYYQDFPIFAQDFDPASALTVAGQTFRLGRDFLPVSGGRPRGVASAQVFYVGSLMDTTSSIDSATVAGKVLLVQVNNGMTAQQNQALVRSASYLAYRRARAGAAAIMSVQPDSVIKQVSRFILGPQLSMDRLADAPETLPSLFVSSAVAEAIMGGSPDGMARGTLGKVVSLNIVKSEKPSVPGRNVVAILPGADPTLRGEYVAIGAHSDHISLQTPPREHDSVKVFLAVGQPAGAEGGRSTPLTADEWAKINADIAAMRKIYPARLDSISNGADDDGSGTVSVLEIAEAFAKGHVKPKRSILFVWHAGEERGMWGSGYFMGNPTIPRDSVVAQLNIDMVGRGEASDETGLAKDGTVLHGSPGYLQLVGSRRLSTELGDLVESVNTTKHHNLTFDYSEDADGHPQDIYCRSDHWSYAKWGVPVTFFTTGGHADYHQVTDEPQYIQYGHMAHVDSLIFDVAVAVADLDHRIVVDKPKPNPAPATACRQ
jgi:Peptidase family M28